MDPPAANDDVLSITSVTLPADDTVNNHECTLEEGRGNGSVTRPLRAKSCDPGGGAATWSSGRKSIRSVRWTLHGDTAMSTGNMNDNRMSFARRLSSVVVEIDRAKLDNCSTRKSISTASTSDPLRTNVNEYDTKEEVSAANDPAISSHEDVGTTGEFTEDTTTKREGSWRKYVSQTFEAFSNMIHTKVFGDQYSKREGGFVVMLGALIALNSGMVNGSCMSGLLFPSGEFNSVAGFTAEYTQSGLAMAEGDWSTYAHESTFIFTYILGVFISGLLTPDATSYQIEPTYGPTFLIGGCFLMTASILASLEFDPKFVFLFAVASNGIQNGIASIYSANLVRCSLTGATTDLALVAAQVVRGNRKGMWKGFVLATIVVSFWTGGLVSFFLTRRYLSHTLFFNAALYLLIGLSLVVFLVKEIGISFKTAVFGTWKWKKTMGKLQKSITNSEKSVEFTKDTLLNMFDEIDHDGNGVIDNSELLDKCLLGDFRITAKEVRALIKTVDENGDGKIDREEWSNLVSQIVDE